MGDLEEIDVGQVVLQQRRIDAFLDIAHQQHAARADLAEQDDRHVIDAGPAVGRGHRHLAADRPQDAQPDLVHVEVVPRCEAHPDRRTGSRQVPQPGGIAGPRTAHPGFEDAGDLVALEEQRQASDVVLVRMTEDHGIDPAIPRWHPGVEHDHQPARVRTAIDQESTAA